MKARAARKHHQRFLSGFCSLLLLAATCWLLSGCLHRPAVQPASTLTPPAKWRHAPQPAGGIQDQPRHTQAWWPQYGLDNLNQAVNQALSQQGDVRAAALRLRNAALRADAQAAALWPTPSGSFSASYNRPLSGEARATRSFGSSLNAGWEIDLWGKLLHQRDMAIWEQEATAQDCTAAILTLAANVVRQYWQLAAINRRLELSWQSLDYARQTLQLTEAQYAAGAVSGLELAQARQAVQTQEAALVGLKHQREEVRHAMALLLGITPGTLPQMFESAALLPKLAQRIHVDPGLPASILKQRPDLAASGLRLRASLASIEVQQRSFYPSLSLSAALSAGDKNISRILANPAMALSSVLSLPFLNIGELRRNPAIAQNEYDQAVIAFHQKLLQALAEVENALSLEQSQAESLGRQMQLLEQAERIEMLTGIRYRAGQISLRQWLDSQETRRQAGLTVIDTQLNWLLAQAALFQSLGWGAPAFVCVDVQEKNMQR